MRSRTELIRTLAVYQRARTRLTADFVREEPNLYHAMFAFRPGSAAMQLALERHIFLWLMEHAHLYQDLYLTQSDAESCTEKALFSQFINNYHHYCRCFLNRANPDSSNAEHTITHDILKHKISFLEDLLKIDQNATSRLQTVRYQSAKAKSLYERKFAELRGEIDAAGHTG